LADRTNIDALIEQLDTITAQAEKLETRFADALAKVHPDFYDSARNLVHYIALRHVDIRELQEHLSSLGLSSLGGVEKNVMSSIGAVRNALGMISKGQDYDLDEGRRNFEQSSRRLDTHIIDLLGADTDGGGTRIMVTLPEEAADDYQLVHDLSTSGMDIARINCAHENESIWLRMIENIKRARKDTGRGCKIIMDLASRPWRSPNSAEA
jgi:pyruvate kinase